MNISSAGIQTASATSPRVVQPPFIVRTVRTRPRLYSPICKARLFYSRHIAGAKARRTLQRNQDLFRTSNFEAQQILSLRQQGYSLAQGYFPTDLIDRIYAQADAMFRNLEIDFARAYSVQSRQRHSLEGLSYEELAATEKMIALRDPLLQIPELPRVAFNESILRIAANFLGCVPRSIASPWFAIFPTTARFIRAIFTKTTTNPIRCRFSFISSTSMMRAGRLFTSRGRIITTFARAARAFRATSASQPTMAA